MLDLIRETKRNCCTRIVCHFELNATKKCNMEPSKVDLKESHLNILANLTRNTKKVIQDDGKINGQMVFDNIRLSNTL